MPSYHPNKEVHIQLALQAYRDKKFSSLKKVAEYYGAVYKTLCHRAKGRPACSPIQKQPKLQLLTDAQESALVQWCIDLFEWGYPVRYDLLRGMASKLAGIEVRRSRST